MSKAIKDSPTLRCKFREEVVAPMNEANQNVTPGEAKLSQIRKTHRY